MTSYSLQRNQQGTFALDAGRLGCLSTEKLLPILSYFTGCGMSDAEVLQGTTIRPGALPGPGGMLSVRDCERMVKNGMAQLSQSPHLLGLAIGISLRPTAFGQFGYMTMCCSTFDEVLRNASRFMPLVTPLLCFEYTEGEHSVYIDVVELARIHDPLYGFLMGLFLGCLRSISTFLLGDRLLALIDDSRVELRIDATTCPDVLMLQQGPITMSFGCEYNRISFSKTLAFHPLPNGNKSALTTAVATCEQLLQVTLQQRTQSLQHIVVRVGEEIARHPRCSPELDDVATTLCVSPRTLSRQLKACETSFSTLVIDIRMAKAEALFKERVHSMKEIAYRLGYSEVSNFSIAFKKYFGQSPREFRGQLNA